MSFAKNDSQQISFDDALFNLTSRERKMLEKSWAKPFADKIFPKIKEDDFAVLYSDKASRPNTPVNVIIGGMILKELLGLTDDEFVSSLLFDVRFQYALHTTSFEEQPISDRTFSRFRKRCLTYEMETGEDLIHDCIKSLSAEMASIMKIDGHLKRMDSLMISSNIRRLSRLELIYTCVADFVKLLHQTGQDELIKGMEHYYDPDDYNRVIYYSRSEDFDNRLTTILGDAEKLLLQCQGGYDDFSEYQLLVRVLREQTVKDESGNTRLRTKEDGGMDSHILQNPSDPEATYREKAGKSHRGYAANVTESIGENGTVVTDYQYADNTRSDISFLEEYIDGSDAGKDTTLITDGAYSSQELERKASDKGISLVTTDLTGREANDIHADFKFSENGMVTECPAGHSPKSACYIKKTGQCRASFNRSQCESCPYKDRCRPKIFKRTSIKFVSKKSAARAESQRGRQTEEFRNLARVRNGVETIPSILRRKYRIDEMPVRGKKNTKLRFGFKIGALNFNKLFRYLNGLGSYTLNQALT